MNRSRLWRATLLSSVLLSLTPSLALATPDAGALRVQALKATFGQQTHVDFAPLSGQSRTIRHLRKLDIATTGENAQARAVSFVSAYAQALDLTHLNLSPVEQHTLATGAVVSFALAYQGIPVEGRSVAIRLSPEGRVRSVTSDALPFELSSTTPALSAEQALAAVKTQRAYPFVGEAKLRVLVSGPHLAQLAYKVNVAYVPFQSHYSVFVDANTGAILSERPLGFDQLPLRHGHH